MNNLLQWFLRFVLFVILFYCLISCKTPEQRVQRLVNKFNLNITDTIIETITKEIPKIEGTKTFEVVETLDSTKEEIKKDSVGCINVVKNYFKNEFKDTLFYDKDGVHVKVYHVGKRIKIDILKDAEKITTTFVKPVSRIKLDKEKINVAKSKKHIFSFKTYCAIVALLFLLLILVAIAMNTLKRHS